MTQPKIETGKVKNSLYLVKFEKEAFQSFLFFEKLAAHLRDPGDTLLCQSFQFENNWSRHY